MDGWFKRVQHLFNETKLSTLPTDELKCYLWNCDETGFVTAKKIFVAIRMSMRQWKEVAMIILQYWELAVLMALDCLHLLFTKERICGAGG